MNLQMVDLRSQYDKIQSEIDQAVLDVIRSTRFIGGPEVTGFAEELGDYLGGAHVVPCANGTDALQIALMALGLEPGDKVIVPAFTYVATAEVIALLGLHPVMVDADPVSYNMTADHFREAITDEVKAVVPVHLFGQGVHMQPLMKIAREHGIYVIEDTAQAIGAHETSGGEKRAYGTIGDIGCTSFFPSKNLGCYGDGGAIMTNDKDLHAKIKMIANHGQSRRYYHDRIGVNSRLDAIQAAVLRIKLRHLDEYNAARTAVADAYDSAFAQMDLITTPYRSDHSTHVYHQYVMRIADGRRDDLAAYLKEKDIPHNIYYPVPLYKQKAFAEFSDVDHLPVTETLCEEVIALPIHTEMTQDMIDHICNHVKSFS